MKRSQAFAGARYVEGISLGFFVATILFGFILLAFVSTRTDWTTYVTTIAPVIAVFTTGWLTASAIQEQIKKQLESEENSRLDNLKATKIRLYFALAAKKKRVREIQEHIISPELGYSEDWQDFTRSNDVVMDCIKQTDLETARSLKDLLLWEEGIIWLSEGKLQNIPADLARHDMQCFNVERRGPVGEFDTRYRLLVEWATYHECLRQAMRYAYEEDKKDKICKIPAIKEGIDKQTFYDNIGWDRLEDQPKLQESVERRLDNNWD